MSAPTTANEPALRDGGDAVRRGQDDAGITAGTAKRTPGQSRAVCAHELEVKDIRQRRRGLGPAAVGAIHVIRSGLRNQRRTLPVRGRRPGARNAAGAPPLDESVEAKTEPETHMRLAGKLDGLRSAHVEGRLQTNLMAWLTTISPSGRPHSVPVWFLVQDDDTILIYSHPLGLAVPQSETMSERRQQRAGGCQWGGRTRLRP